MGWPWLQAAACSPASDKERMHRDCGGVQCAAHPRKGRAGTCWAYPMGRSHTEQELVGPAPWAAHMPWAQDLEQHASPKSEAPDTTRGRARRPKHAPVAPTTSCAGRMHSYRQAGSLLLAQADVLVSQDRT